MSKYDKYLPFIEDVKKNRYDNVAYANDLLEAAVRMVDLYK